MGSGQAARRRSDYLQRTALSAALEGVHAMGQPEDPVREHQVVVGAAAVTAWTRKCLATPCQLGAIPTVETIRLLQPALPRSKGKRPTRVRDLHV